MASERYFRTEMAPNSRAYLWEGRGQTYLCHQSFRMGGHVPPLASNVLLLSLLAVIRSLKYSISMNGYIAFGRRSRGKIFNLFASKPTNLWNVMAGMVPEIPGQKVNGQKVNGQKVKWQIVERDKSRKQKVKSKKSKRQKVKRTKSQLAKSQQAKSQMQKVK